MEILKVLLIVVEIVSCLLLVGVVFVAAPAGLLAYSAAAVTVLLLGALCFRALRRGFADVL